MDGIMAGYYLITSTETGKQYKRKKLKERYENIKNGQIQNKKFLLSFLNT